MTTTAQQQGKREEKAIENARVFFDALKTIARGYQTSDQLRKRAGQYGLSHTEELEMSYENIQQVAANAIRGKRRP